MRFGNVRFSAPMRGVVTLRSDQAETDEEDLSVTDICAYGSIVASSISITGCRP